MVGVMETGPWYWCLTHERVEANGERDDPTNSLGPYDSPEAAGHWQARRDERDEAWQAVDDAWNDEDDRDQDRDDGR